MPRRARVVFPGIPHHVTQRGNDRQAVFHSDGDRRCYVATLTRYARANQVRILGYALMPNHVHLIAVPERADSLAKTLQRAHSEYAAGWNRSGGRTGHLWQGRYYSCPLDRTHLMMALRYVDLNPVRAGLVSSAMEWKWSSAMAHIEPGCYDPLLDCAWAHWFRRWNYSEWKELLQAASATSDDWKHLRRSTHTGEPFGLPDFVLQLEKESGRRLRIATPGRPKRGQTPFPLG
jgi:putative transposase